MQDGRSKRASDESWPNDIEQGLPLYQTISDAQSCSVLSSEQICTPFVLVESLEIGAMSRSH
jgi:hypothetical protein